MSFLKTIRSSMRGDSSGEDTPGVELSADDQALTERYDKLNERDALAALADLNQAELGAIEDHERSHRGRETVLNKVRYLRTPEPLPGYDTLEPSAIAAALADADVETIKAARVYERKMQNRPGVNKDIMDALHALHERRGFAAADPADAEPVLQPPVVGNGLPIKEQPESNLGTP
jgi:hypothetical protein